MLLLKTFAHLLKQRQSLKMSKFRVLTHYVDHVRYQHDDSKVIASVHDLISIIKKKQIRLWCIHVCSIPYVAAVGSFLLLKTSGYQTNHHLHIYSLEQEHCSYTHRDRFTSTAIINTFAAAVVKTKANDV